MEKEEEKVPTVKTNALKDMLKISSNFSLDSTSGNYEPINNKNNKNSSNTDALKGLLKIAAPTFPSQSITTSSSLLDPEPEPTIFKLSDIEKNTTTK